MPPCSDQRVTVAYSDWMGLISPSRGPVSYNHVADGRPVSQ